MILKVAESSILALENNDSLSFILNTTISSSSNKVMIRFQSDHTISRKGFKIHFNRVHRKFLTADSCIGDQTVIINGSISGYLTSPNYPGHYHPNNNCSWLITTEDMSLIKLTFQYLSIERTDNFCIFDWLQIHD